MSRSRLTRNMPVALGLAISAVIAGLAAFQPSAQAQERREREPNSVYAARRAKLAAEVDAPIVLWGFTGREEIAQTYIFEQEQNFYYLTGHNEEGAAIIIMPGRTGASSSERGEILFLPTKDTVKEKWNAFRMSPKDPSIEARTGFPSVKPFDDFKPEVEKLSKAYSTFYTILPYQKENGGYPHEKDVAEFLNGASQVERYPRTDQRHAPD
jgi:Xaa-Pro aminopeptidase